MVAGLAAPGAAGLQVLATCSRHLCRATQRRNTQPFDVRLLLRLRCARVAGHRSGC